MNPSYLDLFAHGALLAAGAAVDVELDGVLGDVLEDLHQAAEHLGLQLPDEAAGEQARPADGGGGGSGGGGSGGGFLGFRRDPRGAGVGVALRLRRRALRFGPGGRRRAFDGAHFTAAGGGGGALRQGGVRFGFGRLRRGGRRRYEIGRRHRGRRGSGWRGRRRDQAVHLLAQRPDVAQDGHRGHEGHHVVREAAVGQPAAVEVAPRGRRPPRRVADAVGLHDALDVRGEAVDLLVENGVQADGGPEEDLLRGGGRRLFCRFRRCGRLRHRHDLGGRRSLFWVGGEETGQRVTLRKPCGP